MGTEGISLTFVGANQDAVFMVIECIIQYGIKIGKRRANISWQDYPYSAEAAARRMTIPHQFEPVIGYQFVRTAHSTIITIGHYKANRIVSQYGLKVKGASKQ